MSEMREQGLAALLADVLTEDRPDPELMVRYVQDRDALSTEERDEMEFHLAHTPGVSAQLSILRRTWSASVTPQPGLTATPAAAPEVATAKEPSALRSVGRAPARRSRWVLLGPVVTLAAAAALTVILRPGADRSPGAPSNQQTARNDTRPAPVTPSDPRPQAEPPSSPERDSATQPPDSESQPRPMQMASLDLPAYRRPSGAGERPRLGSATRGTAQGLRIEALVPDHVGRTVEASPTLAWFLSQPPRDGSELQFSIALEQSNEVLAAKRLPLPAAAGIQRIDLAELGIELAPGSRYRWSLLLRGSAGSGGFASTQGFIERIVPDPALQQQLAGASEAERASSRAQAGLWYDALNAVLDRRSASPGDASAEQALTALLGAAKLSLLQ